MIFINFKCSWYIPNSMEYDASREANSHSDCQIPRTVWNSKVHYFFNKIPVLTLSQLHPFQNFSPYFSKIRSNINLPSTPVCSKWFLPFGFSNQTFAFISHLPHACYMPIISFIFILLPSNMWWSVKVMKFLIMQSCAFYLGSFPGCRAVGTWGWPLTSI
jgi:hypothetical protein